MPQSCFVHLRMGWGSCNATKINALDAESIEVRKTEPILWRLRILSNTTTKGSFRLP